MCQLTLDLHRIRRIALSASTALALVTATAGAQVPVRDQRVPTWQQLGPLVDAGAFVWQLAQTQADPARVYAGTSAGIAVSFDHGASWELRWDSPPAARRSASYVTASPANPDLVLATTTDGRLLRSADGGMTWSRPPGSPLERFLFDVGFAPSDPTVALLVTTDGCYKSTDAGLSFTKVLSGVEAMGGWCWKLGIDPDDPQHIYIPSVSLGVFETMDGGANWTQKPLPNKWPLSFAVDPADGDRLLVGTSSGVYLSTDAGSNWTATGAELAGKAIDSVSFDPDDPDRFYAGPRFTGFALSDDAGVSWSISTDPGLDSAGGDPRTILASESDPNLTLIGDSGGIFRSTDSGLTFVRANTGLEKNAHVWGIVIDPFDPLHLIAKTGGSIYSSHDGGQSWSEATGMRVAYGYGLAVDAVTPNRYYASAANGVLWRSDDGGNSLYEAYTPTGGGPQHFWYCVAHPTISGRLYATGDELWRSDDGGLSFAPTSLSLTWTWAFAISPVDPQIMYCSGRDNVHHSEDGGLTWLESPAPPAGIVRGLAADPQVADRVFAVSPNHGLYRSDDRGQTWVLVGLEGHSPDSVLAPTSMPGLLLANDFLVPVCIASEDGGDSTFRLGSGLRSRLTSFAASPVTIFAGSDGSGVLQLD